MNKLKQGDKFTDMKGNEYRYDEALLKVKLISGEWVNTGLFDAQCIKLIEQGELIPVKPKTAADEMLEWLDIQEMRNDLLSIPHIRHELKQLIAKHEEKQ